MTSNLAIVTEHLVFCYLTVDVVLYLGPPALQAGLDKVQLFVGDAVGGRVWRAVDGVSALGEGLVNGGPLAV